MAKKTIEVGSIKEFLGRASSRKFLLSLGTILFIIANKRFSLGIEDADIYTIAGIVGLYVGVEGYKDIKEVK